MLNVKLFAKALSAPSPAMMDGAGVGVRITSLPSYAKIEGLEDKLYGRKGGTLQRFYCQTVRPVLFKRRYEKLVSDVDALAMELTKEWLEACIIEAARIIERTSTGDHNNAI